ncbi:hypothetical protein LUU34_00933000 [Aix galericulata]|nr:hypothetical protein LUU34_00933000 [Aix galericulata]
MPPKGRHRRDPPGCPGLGDRGDIPAWGPPGAAGGAGLMLPAAGPGSAVPYRAVPSRTEPGLSPPPPRAAAELRAPPRAEPGGAAPSRAGPGRAVPSRLRCGGQSGRLGSAPKTRFPSVFFPPGGRRRGGGRGLPGHAPRCLRPAAARSMRRIRRLVHLVLFCPLSKGLQVQHGDEQGSGGRGPSRGGREGRDGGGEPGAGGEARRCPAPHPATGSAQRGAGSRGRCWHRDGDRQRGTRGWHRDTRTGIGVWGPGSGTEGVALWDYGERCSARQPQPSGRPSCHPSVCLSDR